MTDNYDDLVRRLDDRSCGWQAAPLLDEAAATIRALREECKEWRGYTAEWRTKAAIAEERVKDYSENSALFLREKERAEAERDDYKTQHDAIMHITGHSEVSSRPLYLTVEDVVKQRDAALKALRDTVERMRVAAMMQDWDDFNAAIDVARAALKDAP